MSCDLARRWFHEVWTLKRTEAIDELTDPGARMYGLGGPEPLSVGEFKKLHRHLCDEIPDIQVEVTHAIEQNDWVAIHAVVTGTHAATGRPIRFEGGGFGRVENGVFAEMHNTWDFLGYLAQIGRVPTETVAAAFGQTGG